VATEQGVLRQMIGRPSNDIGVLPYDCGDIGFLLSSASTRHLHGESLRME
jgi:hypothetical protein